MLHHILRPSSSWKGHVVKTQHACRGCKVLLLKASMYLLYLVYDRLIALSFDL